jgi:hypothetical protein
MKSLILLLAVSAILFTKSASAQTVAEIFAPENIANIACYPKVNGKAQFPYTLWNDDHMKVETKIYQYQDSKNQMRSIGLHEAYSAKTGFLKIEFRDAKTDKILSATQIKLTKGQSITVGWDLPDANGEGTITDTCIDKD